MASAYQINPTPQAGSGPLGAVPGVIGLPNPAQSLGAQIPGLPKLNATASGDIQSNLSGTLSPGTTNALQDEAATMGVTSGMPDSGLSWNSLYGNIAGASTAQQAQGLQELNPFVQSTNATQTVSPGLQTEIAGTNASNAASPNPAASASYSQNIFQQYLKSIQNPANGLTAGNPATDNSGDPYSVFSVGAFPYSPDYAGGGDQSAYAQPQGGS